MTRRELLCTHTATEMTLLRAMDARGEIGERRMDLRFAKLAMHLVACLRSSKGGPVKLAEFLLAAVDDPSREADADDELARFDRQAGLQ